MSWVASSSKDNSVPIRVFLGPNNWKKFTKLEKNQKDDLKVCQPFEKNQKDGLKVCQPLEITYFGVVR